MLAKAASNTKYFFLQNSLLTNNFILDLTILTWNAESLDGNISFAVPNNMHLSHPDQLNAAGVALRNIYTDTTFQSNLSNVVRVSRLSYCISTAYKKVFI